MKTFIKYLTLGLLASPIFVDAQTYVGTSTTKRVAVLEEMTGNYCTYCPDGHKIAQNIEASKGNLFIPLKIQTGQYAYTDPIFGGNLKTPTGDIIASEFDQGGWPNATVNRSPSYTSISRGSWSSAVNTITAEDSPVNIYVAATLDATTRQMNVTVEYYYTASEANSTNYLHIGYYQDNIAAYQYNAKAYNSSKLYISDIELYEFDHCFRDNLTPTPSSGTWGDLIGNTTATSTAIVSKSITLPADFNGFDIEAGGIKVFAYISKTSKGEIITAAKAEPVVSNYPEADNVGIIYAIPGADENCIGKTGNAAPTILFGNKGGNDLTSFSYTSGVNGAGSPTPWAGNLAPSEKKAMKPTVGSFTFQTSNTLNVILSNPNGNSDEDNSDNTLSVNFNGSSRAFDAQIIRVDASVDNYGATESSWKMYDGNGSLVTTSGKLSKNATTSKTIILDDNTSDCYQFELLDSYGDGWGSGKKLSIYKLNGGVETLLFSKSASDIGNRATVATEFSNALSANNIESKEVSLYPNPTNGSTTLELDITSNNNAKVEVLNALGQVVFTKTLNNVSGNQKININSEVFENGLYLVNINVNGGVITKKLTVTK